MVPGGLFRCLTPRPCVSPADKGRVLGSVCSVVTDAHFKGHWARIEQASPTLSQ